MKGIIIGDWQWEIYEKALYNGFVKNGINMDSFKIPIEKNRLVNILQYKLRSGQLIDNINNKIQNKIILNNYDFVFFQRPVLIKRKTLKNIKDNCKAKIICFHNDNPFQHTYKYFKYRRYFNILPLCDIVYVYRPSNIIEAKNHGANNTKILMPYYIKDFHDKQIDTKKKYDVTFIGHYENDGRSDYCEFLIKNNINLRIIGHSWDKIKNNKILKNFKIKKSAFGDEYIKEIKSSKIALVFLSKLNRDVYTRRNFEIPAIGTFMLTQKSNELKKLFIENEQCAYFESKESLLSKVNYFLENETLRENIAINGHIKNNKLGFNNINCAKKILKDINY